MLRTYQPTSIFDMSLVTAAIRPSGASYRDDLLSRKPHRNPSQIIDELLADNNGYLVYQCDIIKFLQLICGLSGSEADNVRRAIGRKDSERLQAALPRILDGYCSKSAKPRMEAEAEAKEFLKIIEDASSYMFGYNHSIAYCMLGYLCAYYRYYHPLEYLTAYMNNAANDDDIKNGTAYAESIGIRVTLPKWGTSRSDYFFNIKTRTIAKGLASIKYMGAGVADELYSLAKTNAYSSFMDLLLDLTNKTSLDSRQLDILIKLDYFDTFGNQRELLRLVEAFNILKQGTAKKLLRGPLEGTRLGEIVSRYSTFQKKNGEEAKSFTILDATAILHDAEDALKSAKMPDLPELTKIRNVCDILGYPGYITGKEEDRKRLYVLDTKPLHRKSDGKLFGHSVYTKSIGSGVEARFTVFEKLYNKDPIRKGDCVLCKSFNKDGQYFQLTAYEKIFP